MKATTKQNANSANKPIIMQPKAGVFFNKDQKMLTLEKRNQQLKSQLDEEMRKFNDYTKKTQESKIQSTKLDNQYSLLQLEQMMLHQSIAKIQSQLAQKDPIIIKQQKSLEEMMAEVNMLQIQLNQMVRANGQQENLIKRYREELRMEKMMLKSEKNLNNVCESLKKTLEGSDKNIGILENKLESKKKYLAILQKKQEKLDKEYEQREKEKQTYRKEVAKTLSSSKLTISAQKSSHNIQKEEIQQKKQQKKQLKSYNDLIRKKNAILAQKR